MTRREFGTIRKLPSGKHQARYTGPDDKRRTLGSFPNKQAAREALTAVHADILEMGEGWVPPGVDLVQDFHNQVNRQLVALGGKSQKFKKYRPFGKFAAEVMQVRSERLAPGTQQNYDTLLRRYLLPSFEHDDLAAITVQRVDEWWAEMGKLTGKVNRRNAYFLLSGIMRQAVRYKHITANPCMVENAGKNVAKARPFLSLEDVGHIVAELPQPLHAPVWTLFGAHVRLGELLGLNRSDVNVETGMISITKQWQEAKGGAVMRPTKTGNSRTIKMLAPAIEALTAHLALTPDEPDDAPLFRGPKGGRLGRTYLRSQWDKARERAGLPDAHIHDIRHTGLTLVAGFASTKEVMNRGGHTTAAAALKYQHATAERDSAVADAASAALAKK